MQRPEAATGAANDVVLEVSDLETHFFTRQGIVPAVDGVSFKLHRGEVLGIVGESGCGKSVTSLSILRLIPPRSGKIVGGTIQYGDRDLVRASEAEMRRIRGNDISMIFQEPMTALNPVMTVGQQIIEPLQLHQDMSLKEARNRAVEMLKLVHIPEPLKRVDAYPHELSGGMRQRAMIAMALSCNPKILIADEPTTALDVTIQAQILELIQELRDVLGTAVIMITHDLGVIAEMAQRVVVMYAGRKVEEAEVGELFETPLHPYTRGLLRAVPRLGIKDEGRHRARLQTIEGTVPALNNLPPGCAFAPRCANATDLCRVQRPELEDKTNGHIAACWHSGSVAAV
ncbi:MAG: peptide ABC transporter ATP-binding protein [Rhizobiales bacterium NRL2]|jgi:oligopeptide/dipeptide ABC transporter ATP-binding protein|nr:MAG: peptide ABC transporter ATP-binding protein [Rhizobiales bacterium NRL2]